MVGGPGDLEGGPPREGGGLEGGPLDLLLATDELLKLSDNEEFFIGHFPSYPIMPGVLIIEAMAQTAACLVSYSNQNLQGEKVVFLTGVENAKFKKTVNPGCELLLEVKLLSFRRNFFKFSGKAFSDDDLMATSNFSAMLSIEGK